MPQSSPEVKSLDTPALNSVRSVSHEKFANRWKNFEAGVKGLSDFSQYINTLEADLNRLKRLESELRMKTTENAALQTGRQQMLEGFAEKHKDWAAKESRLVGELQVATNDNRSLQNQLAELRGGSISNEFFRRKVQEVEDNASRKVKGVVEEKAAEVQRQQKSTDALEKKFKRLEVELSKKSILLLGCEVELERCRTDLKEKKAEIGLEELSADFAPALEHLSVKFRNLAREYFFTKLPKELNCDDLFTELQRSRFMSVVSKAIPIANSEASKYLRMAAAESVIANKVAEKMLQPLYILDSNVKDTLEDMLDTLFQKSPRQESILRSLLLAAYTSERTIRETDILNTVVDDARSILNPLLFDEVHGNAFAAGLNTLLLESLDLWSQVQKSPERVLASMEGKNWDWGSHEEHDAAISLTAAELALVSSSQPIMTLFPRVYSPKKSVPWHSGFSLWSDQGIVVAGDLEAREQVARVNSRNGKMNGVAGKRRISASSPTTKLSFQQRMKSHSESTRDPNAEKGSVIGSVDEHQFEKALPRPSGSV